jgi:lysophospholipase L1-like esterase
MKQLYRIYAFIVAITLYMDNDLLSQSSIPSGKNELLTSNCTNWEPFRQKFVHLKNKEKTRITILFLGDSHIQGGYSVNRIRDLFRQQGDSTGRGFSFPYSFARTNGPEDIIFRSSAHWKSSKWSNTTDNINSPFGYVLSTTDTAFNFSFSYKSGETAYPFQKITIFHSPDSFELAANQAIKIINKGRLTSNICFTVIQLPHPSDSCLLTFHIPGVSKGFTLYSLLTEKLEESITVSAMGINGISYQLYSRKIHPEPWLSFIHPDCVVLSLGTNDVYAGMSDTSEIHHSITKLVRKIKQSAPGAIWILTTPNDHLLRKKYSNRHLPELCAIIKNVANEEQCAIWDFFSVMGGSGSARELHHKGLLFKDFVHLSKNGYKYQGELFFEALQNALNQK